MKLIIQIPCLNEADSLPDTLAHLPRQVEGFDTVEVMVIDDGSTDNTVAVARSLGVDHIIRMNGHQGLARTFLAGLSAAVERGADVIVNTDADNQYAAQDIAALVCPLLKGRADIVIGARPLKSIEHFSPLKRLLQCLGSRVVGSVSSVGVQDATSGFRAITRDAALRLNVFGRFTYTIETLIQAGLTNLRVANVPIRVNGPTRPSRLFRSNCGYICRAILTMASAYLIYRPTWLFAMLSTAFLASGAMLGLRYYSHALTGQDPGHVPSLVGSGVLLMCGIFMVGMGLVAHLLGINRRLLEEQRYLLRSRRAEKSSLALRKHLNGELLPEGTGRHRRVRSRARTLVPTGQET